MGFEKRISIAWYVPYSGEDKLKRFRHKSIRIIETQFEIKMKINKLVQCLTKVTCQNVDITEISI